MDRRKALFGFGATLAAPALIKADHLMKLAKLVMPPEPAITTYWPGIEVVYDLDRDSYKIILSSNRLIVGPFDTNLASFDLSSSDFHIEA